MPRTQQRSLSPTAAAFRDAIHQHIKYSLGKTHESCTQRELYLAVVLALRNRLIDSRLETEANYRKVDAKRLYYLSMEYLIGRSLNTNLQNLSMYDGCLEVLQDMGVDLHDVLESEEDAALGNGGWAAWQPVSSTLWRRSACQVTVTALTMNTACSSRSSRTVTRRNTLNDGCFTVSPGSSNDPMKPARFHSTDA